MVAISQEHDHFAALPVVEDTVEIGKLDFSHLAHRDLMELSGPRASEFQVIIRQSTLERIHALGEKTSDSEICGILVGDVYNDATGPYLLVENIIPLQADRGIGRATFSQATWQNLQITIAREFTNRRIVGWYYTHPSQGPTMSALDRFLHDTFFSLPWQIALSFDPIRHEEGVFSGYKGSVRSSPFLVELDNPSKRMAGILSGGAAAKRAKKKKKSSFGTSLKHLIFGIASLVMFAAAGWVFGHILYDWKVIHFRYMHF